MKRKQKTNFVDDIKFAQRGRRSRTSQVDLLNGEGVGEDMGLVQGATLNAIGPMFYAPMDPGPLEPGGGPTIPTASPTPTAPSLSISSRPTVNAGPDQQITLPTSTVTLQGSVQGSMDTNKTWSLISAPNGASPQISTPNSEQTDVFNLTIPGDYVFQLYAKYKGVPMPGPVVITSDNASDTVTISVLQQAAPQPQSPTMPPPAGNSTIDGWDCSQLNSYINVYNQVLSDPTLDQQTRSSYESAVLYINNRISTVCSPSTTPHVDVPTEPTPVPVAPLPTVADINAMNCDQLNSLKTALVTNESAYRTDSTTLQNYINTVNYVDLQFTQKCKNTTPTAPTVEIYAPGTTPYSTGVKSTGGAGGGGGGGGSTSKATPQPTQQSYKKWWWLGVVVVVGALILFKPGTKVGVPSK